MQITLSINNSDLKGDLAKYIEKTRAKLMGIAKQTAFNVVQDSADKHTRSGQFGTTGDLLASVSWLAMPSGFTVYNDTQIAPHAIFVHWGTRPHPIPKQPMPHPVTGKKVLRWVGKDSKFHFAKQVQHPGYMGDRWMELAMNKAFEAMLHAKL